jgi:integrase
MDLKTANAKIDRVKIRQKGDKLYLRATLPCKPGHGDGAKQYELSTGCRNTPEGIKIALGKAKKLEADILLDRFDWKNWGIDFPEDTPPAKHPNIETLIEQFTVDHWHKTPKNPNTESYFEKSYLGFLKKLPLDEPLSPANLKATLLKWPPNTATRIKAYTALTALAQFAGIEANLTPYRGKYKPPVRDIPTDPQIQEFIDALPREYQWFTGMMATYGLRNHETFHLDIGKIRNPPHQLTILRGKTGARIAYPVPGEWVERWQLWDCRWPPKWKIEPDMPNTKLGQKITNYLSETANFEYDPYALRDAYAVRASLQEIPPQIIAKWLGHSLKTFYDSYFQTIQGRDFDQLWIDKFFREEIREEKTEA